MRVRFAPSPTGYLHVGGARTALFNWLVARQSKGTFILRMEDTDAARNTESSRQTIFDGLRWLGLDPDEGPEKGGPHGPYSQSERTESYEAGVKALQDSGVVYPCFCTRERLQSVREEQERNKAPYGYDRACRDLEPGEAQHRQESGESHTFRLRVPDGETVIEDAIRGRIVVDHRDIDDFILVRAEGTPVYNFAVVLDDHHMKVDLVMRGEDHLTNTFKQALLYNALEWEMPRFAHLPLILGPTGEGKLSKRKHPEAALEHYIEAGYHRDAFLNWLARLGWSVDDKTEIMSRQEMIDQFSLDRVNKSGARLNLDKLESLSGHYIREMDAGEFAKEVARRLAACDAESTAGLDDARVRELAALVQPRVNRFDEIAPALSWLLNPIDAYEGKVAKNLRKGEDSQGLLLDYAKSLPDPLPGADALEESARAFAKGRELGFGKFVQPVRAALTGEAGGPPLFDCLVALGREEALVRLEAAARWLDTQE